MVFCKKGFPKNFAKVTRKHQWQSLFFNKFPGRYCGIFDELFECVRPLCVVSAKGLSYETCLLARTGIFLERDQLFTNAPFNHCHKKSNVSV